MKMEKFISDAGWATNTTRERLSPFVRGTIRRKYDEIIINEKVVLTDEWLNLNSINK